MAFSFLSTSETSPITQLALPLASKAGAGYYASGTACLVSPGIAIAASHVVEDHWERCCEGRPLQRDALGNFSLLALQTLDAGRGRVLWETTRVWLSPITDVAFLGLRHLASNVETVPSVCFRLDLLPPPVGARVTAFGYRKSEIRLPDPNDPLSIEWHDEPTTSVGFVQEIYTHD